MEGVKIPWPIHLHSNRVRKTFKTLNGMKKLSLSSLLLSFKEFQTLQKNNRKDLLQFKTVLRGFL